MYSYIKGKVASVSENLVVLDVGGVGYAVNVSKSTAAAISGKSEAMLYTYLHVKEDALTLFGFISGEEKYFFEKLITVSGVGPKSAMTVLGSYPLNLLASMVASGDTVSLTKIKGLGKKTAERIVLELKEQFKPDIETVDSVPSELEDAIFALMSLGLGRQEAQKAVESAAKHTSGLENIVSLALRERK